MDDPLARVMAFVGHTKSKGPLVHANGVADRASGKFISADHGWRELCKEAGLDPHSIMNRILEEKYKDGYAGAPYKD